MKQKLLFFVLSLAAIAAFIGCHAGGNAPFVNVPEDEQVVILNATVGENGKFPDVTFPSGTSIKCSEGVNLQEGTELTFEERKTTLNGVSTLLYTMNASLDSVNITNSIEHPLNVTILNNSDSETIRTTAGVTALLLTEIRISDMLDFRQFRRDAVFSIFSNLAFSLLSLFFRKTRTTPKLILSELSLTNQLALKTANISANLL